MNLKKEENYGYREARCCGTCWWFWHALLNGNCSNVPRAEHWGYCRLYHNHKLGEPKKRKKRTTWHEPLGGATSCRVVKQ